MSSTTPTAGGGGPPSEERYGRDHPRSSGEEGQEEDRNYDDGGDDNGTSFGGVGDRVAPLSSSSSSSWSTPSSSSSSPSSPSPSILSLLASFSADCSPEEMKFSLRVAVEDRMTKMKNKAATTANATSKSNSIATASSTWTTRKRRRRRICSDAAAMKDDIEASVMFSVRNRFHFSVVELLLDCYRGLDDDMEDDDMEDDDNSGVDELTSFEADEEEYKEDGLHPSAEEDNDVTSFLGGGGGDGGVRSFLPLHAACRFGSSLEVVVCLIRFDPGWIVAKEPGTGNTPLHYACQYYGPEFLDVVRVLLNKHDAQRKQRRLGCATTKGNSSLVAMENDDGFTPLHYACQLGASIKLTTCLAQNFYDSQPDGNDDVTTQKSPTTTTPLHIACRVGAPVCVIRSLIRQRPDSATAKNVYGRTPLHETLLCSSPFAMYPAVQFFVAEYPDLTCVPDDAENKLPLHYACGYDYRNADEFASSFAFPIARMLLRSYPDAVARRDAPPSGRTPLHYACSNVHVATPQIVRHMLEYDRGRLASALFAADSLHGHMPIHCACSSEPMETISDEMALYRTIQTLLQFCHGPPTPPQATRNNRQPQHQNRVAGNDVNVNDGHRRRPHRRRRGGVGGQGGDGGRRRRVDAGAGMSGSGGTPQSSLAIGMIQTKDSCGRTALHCALRHGRSPAIVKLLLGNVGGGDGCAASSSTAQTLLRDRDALGYLPLHYACMYFTGRSFRKTPEDAYRVVEYILSLFPAGIYARAGGDDKDGDVEDKLRESSRVTPLEISCRDDSSCCVRTVYLLARSDPMDAVNVIVPAT